MHPEMYEMNTDCNKCLLCLCISGMQLATASGDTTVKIWDFANAACIHTFADHQKAGSFAVRWLQ